jgi:hypothetical protein
MLSKTIPTDLEPTLRAMLENENPFERDQARLALILLGTPEAERDAMIQAMVESRDNARCLAAANLLIQIRQVRACDPHLAGGGGPGRPGESRAGRSTADPGQGRKRNTLMDRRPEDSARLTWQRPEAACWSAR